MITKRIPLGEFIDLLSETFDNERPQATITPRSAVYTAADTLIFEIDLPGVDPTSLDIAVQKNRMTVTAEREQLPVKEAVLADNAPRGRFEASFTLPKTVNPTDGITASYQDGVLVIEAVETRPEEPETVNVDVTLN